MVFKVGIFKNFIRKYILCTDIYLNTIFEVHLPTVFVPKEDIQQNNEIINITMIITNYYFLRNRFRLYLAKITAFITNTNTL